MGLVRYPMSPVDRIARPLEQILSAYNNTGIDVIMGKKVGAVILVVAVGAVSAQSVLPKLEEEVRRSAPRGNSAFEVASKIRDKAKLRLNSERGITRFAKLWQPDAACLEEPRRLIRVRPGAEWP